MTSSFIIAIRSGRGATIAWSTSGCCARPTTDTSPRRTTVEPQSLAEWDGRARPEAEFGAVRTRPTGPTTGKGDGATLAERLAQASHGPLGPQAWKLHSLVQML
jgi:hypothetical protein